MVFERLRIKATEFKEYKNLRKQLRKVKINHLKMFWNMTGAEEKIFITKNKDFSNLYKKPKLWGSPEYPCEILHKTKVNVNLIGMDSYAEQMFYCPNFNKNVGCKNCRCMHNVANKNYFEIKEKYEDCERQYDMIKQQCHNARARFFCRIK